LLNSDTNSAQNEHSRYPVCRTVYCKVVGETREKEIKRVFEELGFNVINHSVNQNGPDIILVDKKRNIVALFEVINENIGSILDKKRAISMRQNLKGVKYKGIICNHGNFTKEAKRILKNIPICLIGFQSLQKPFYDWFNERNNTYKRKITNEKSFNQIKNRVLDFLDRIELTPPMYINNDICNVNCYVECLLPYVVIDL
jgi:hypothetical protein